MNPDPIDADGAGEHRLAATTLRNSLPHWWTMMTMG